MIKKIFIAVAIIISLMIVGAAAFVGMSVYEYSKINYVVNDTLPDGEGKKATVILLGGQSNASGCSRDEYLKKNVSEEKYAEYEAGYDNVYINYFATGTNFSEGFVKCSVRQGEMGVAFGPELGLAEKLNEMYPDRTFFIIKWAWGGSNLRKQWLSPSGFGKTGEFYNHFTKYVETSINYLVSKNYDVTIEGMCWMQGESDSLTVEHAVNYEKNLNNFIEDIRKRFSCYAADGGIAFVDAYIANNPDFWIYSDLLNESKTKVANSSPINVVVQTDDLTTTGEPTEEPDLAHYDSMSEIKLGNRFAEALAEFLD